MNDQHPGKHPGVLVAIVLVCTTLGGLVGHFCPEFGGHGVLTIMGLFLGFSLGVGLSLLWWLLISLAAL
jgi:hypothetical protein